MRPSMHAVKRGFSRQEAAHYLGVSETSVRELERLGYVTRHKLIGLTLEVFYKEDLDAYLDKSLARERLTVVSSEDYGKKGEGRGVGVPKGKGRKVGRLRDDQWATPLSYSPDQKRGGGKTKGA